jgi:hypothetical protein
MPGPSPQRTPTSPRTGRATSATTPAPVSEGYTIESSHVNGTVRWVRLDAGAQTVTTTRPPQKTISGVRLRAR